MTFYDVHLKYQNYRFIKTLLHFFLRPAGGNYKKEKDKKERMAENFPNIRRYLDTQGACYNFNSKWSSSRYIIKVPKIKVKDRV